MGVEIDTVRKILILPGKEPVPVMRRPVWSFMEREVADDQLCWTAMNPGYQGEGLIEGVHRDYIVEKVLDSGFVFKHQPFMTKPQTGFLCLLVTTTMRTCLLDPALYHGM